MFLYFFPDDSLASQEPDTEAAYRAGSYSIHGKEMEAEGGAGKGL